MVLSSRESLKSRSLSQPCETGLMTCSNRGLGPDAKPAQSAECNRGFVLNLVESDL
jgi:hypothetical protein